MHRVGAAPADVPALVARIAAAAPAVRLAGIFTHLAVADELDDPYTAGQLAAFDEVLDGARRRTCWTASSCTPPTRPAASPIRRARRAFVRAGIAMYGISPGPASTTSRAGLRPVLSLRARVSFVKRLAAGDAAVVRAAPQLAARRQRGDRAARLRRRRAPRADATSARC